MILSRPFLIIFIAISSISFSQESSIEDNKIIEEYTFRTKSYEKKDGYVIKNYHTSLVDNYGTLWVGGTVDKSSVNQFNKEFIGLYFFNGTKFQEFPLPDSLKMGSIKLLPGYKKELLVLIKNNKGPTLLSINPYDLTYRKIKLPKAANENVNYLKSFFFKKNLYFLFTNDNKSTIYKINKDETFELFGEIEIKGEATPYFERIVPLKENILLNDKHSGVYILNEKSKSCTKTYSLSLRVQYETEPKIKISNHFKFKDSNFFKFNISSHYFFYDESSSGWIKTNSDRFPFNQVDNHKLFNDYSPSLIFNSKWRNGNNSLEIYLKADNKLATTIQLGEFTNTPKLNSRDFNTEIFVFSQDQITQISYHRIKVKSFLKKLSIRSMLELPDNKVLVGTELNGIKEINLLTGEEKTFSGFLDGKPYSPRPVRGFHQDSSGIYTNYGSGICFIENGSKKITTYRYFPVARFKNKGNSLYYVTNGYKLIRFDKNLKINIPIANTNGINMQDFVFVGDTIYAATLSGLFIYYDGKQELIETPEGSSKFLCVVRHPSLGLLLGSIDGKVLIYNPTNKSFTELYSDEFNSSIATLLVDDLNDIWINSFKGIINYRLKDKSTIRYGVQDGFTDNEANRLATLKLKNGNLLIGTVKGLNYFSPTELSETKIDATLKFTEINYFGSDKKQKSIISPKELKDFKEITLQPQSRNLSISFGFTDVMGLQENLRYKYRLNNEPWRIVNEFGELFLGNLAPDKYTLEIIAINQIEKEIGNPIKLTVIAKQFFYKTAWFWIIVGCIGILISYWIASQYIKNQKLKQHFSDKIINAHIEEQELLSQKLHDSVGQKLLLAKNNFILNKKIPKEELTNLDEIISEVRNISHDLHPLQFKELGFKQSVENLVGDFERNSSIYYSHEIECNKSILSVEKEIILFGIIQECLNNVEKHSEADACQVKVIEKGRNLFIRIKDNGKGFDTNDTSKKFSLGLKTMKEKAGYLDATFEIKSRINEGTKVTLKAKTKH